MKEGTKKLRSDMIDIRLARALLVKVDENLQSIETYELRENTKLTIGRSMKNDIFFADEMVSRKHCFITVNIDGYIFIKDSNSKNGTFVNNININDKPSQLYDGDKINIGNVILMIKIL